MKKQKKTAGSVGVVLHKVNEPALLKPWAEYLAAAEPWKTLEISSAYLLERWQAPGFGGQFFSAATPKAAKMPGFEHEHGLVIFTLDGVSKIVEEKLKGPLPPGLDQAGYVSVLATKTRHKGIGKYLLSAAERIIAEKKTSVLLFVSEFNTSAQRFYKSMGYEEVARAQDVFKPGNVEILLTKKIV